MHWSVDPDPARQLKAMGSFYVLLHRMMARSRAFSGTSSVWSIWAGNGPLARHHSEASPSSSYLARLVGFPERRLTKGVASRRMIAEAARELGVDTDCPLTLVVQGRLEGSPWLQRISYYEATRLERLLQVSCWTVIAYLSGMRDSEIKHLQRGCVSVQRDPDGHIYRYRLNSLAFKGEDAHGAKTTWVVTAPVARAVAVLERLQPEDQPYLFAKPPSSPSHRQRQDPHHVPNSNATNRDLAALITWINTYCAAHQRPDSIPQVKGQVPHLTTRQFRRTLAWFIARRPGGTIAGALQYRHQGIQMFEGYADPRELHQTGVKVQVACSRREPGGLRHYYDLTS